jgi:nitric oxide reductase subunit B
MYVGAVMSTLEVIPLGFLIAYTVVLWRRGEYKTELQKTLLTFVMVAAFGGAIGVVAFGAGLINMPVVNYYLHGSQGTMVHAHLAMPMAYGVPTMLMWVVAFLLAGAFTEKSPPPLENRRHRDGGRLLPTGLDVAHVAHD